MSKTLALVGNPNSGKTTLFNNLTGSKQYVGNWPGVTVERKGGKLKKHDGFEVMDLPGIYSLSPYSPEEVITRNYLLEENPDVIVNIVDGSNLERNLYLTMQLLEMGCKVVVALNMMDLVRANGDVLDTELLSKELGCPVVPITATSGEGVEQLVARAVQIAQTQCDRKDPNSFSEEVERVLQEIGEMVAPMPHIERRWQLVKVLERDGQLLEKLKLSQGVFDKLEVLITRFEQQADDDAASIIASGRYQKIDSMLRSCYKSANVDYANTVSEKIDRIVTNRVLGLPIFLGIMWAVYYICIQTLGDETIGWMEELFEGISEYAGDLLEAAGASEVTACAVSTCYDLAVHDDSAADTGSKGNHNQVLASLSAACPHLTESCCVCVVCCFYCHSAEFVGKLFYDIFISPVQVDCDGKLTFVINRARYVNADTGNIICCDTLLSHFCFYAFCDIRQNFASAVFGAGRDFPFFQQSSVCLEQSAFY